MHELANETVFEERDMHSWKGATVMECIGKTRTKLELQSLL